MALDSWKWSHMFLDQRHILPWKKTELSCPSWPASGQTSWWNGRVPACDLVWLSCLLNLSVPHWPQSYQRVNSLTQNFQNFSKDYKPPWRFQATLKIWKFDFILFCLQDGRNTWGGRAQEVESPSLCLLKISPPKSEVSSFGFSGTNGHGLMEATLSTVEPPQRAPMKFARKASRIRGENRAM